jgi:hypothetical protein
MLLLSGMGETTKHVKAVAQQEHGGSGSKRRNRKRRTRGAFVHLCVTGTNMTKVFSFQAVLLLFQQCCFAP